MEPRRSLVLPKDERPYPPPWPRTPRFSGTFHHVIPYVLLRAVWKVLLDAVQTTNWQESWVATRQYLMLCDPDLRNVDALIDRIRLEAPSQKVTLARKGVRLGEAEVEKMFKHLAWQGWNVVEGPTARSDEPLPGKLDRFGAGLRDGERERMQFVEKLYESYTNLVRVGTEIQPAQLRSFAWTVNGYRLQLQHAGPIPFRAAMWVKEGDRWRKARHGENERP